MHLGELEKLVLKYFWQIKVADVKQVYAHFEKSRGGTLNTIQSTLDRLFKKGLLKRDKEGHAYQYRAAKPRKDFIGELIKDVANDFTAGDEDSILAAFVSLSSELNDGQLEQLESLIKGYRSTMPLDDKT
jgi:predicted transcriptional regulator